MVCLFLAGPPGGSAEAWEWTYELRPMRGLRNLDQFSACGGEKTSWRLVFRADTFTKFSG